MEVRRRIGYLPGERPALPGHGGGRVPPVRGRDARHPRPPSGTAASGAWSSVCGLGPMLQKDIGQLSKGYRQRVGLAATLIHDPEVLVLDEPTSGLDPNQIIEIRELIRQIGREKTVILSTHILPEVEATCSRVLIINEGRIVADGTTEELTRMSAGRATTRAHRARPRRPRSSRSCAASTGSSRCASWTAARPGASRWEVVSPADADIEAKLFHLAVESGWVLTELHTASLSLEQVFLRLTTGEKRS